MAVDFFFRIPWPVFISRVSSQRPSPKGIFFLVAHLLHVLATIASCKEDSQHAALFEL